MKEREKKEEVIKEVQQPIKFTEKLSNQELFVKVFEQMRRNCRKVQPLLKEFCEAVTTTGSLEFIDFLVSLNLKLEEQTLTRFASLFT